MNRQRDGLQELPKETRKDLQIPPGNAALIKASVDPRPEGECSMGADSLMITKTWLRMPPRVITTANDTNCFLLNNSNMILNVLNTYPKILGKKTQKLTREQQEARLGLELHHQSA